MHTREFERQLPCHFTPDQIRDKSDLLAEKIDEKGKIEEEKKSVMTGYKQRLELADAEIGLLAHHIRQKFEYQMVRCVAIMDEPTFGKKTIRRLDTGETVGVETMTNDDRQLVMSFETDAAGERLPDEDAQPRRHRPQ
jgi:hypothetical protein